jgi:hypothetical protein
LARGPDNFIAVKKLQQTGGKIGWWRDQSHTACKDRTSVVNGRKSCLSSDEAGYRAYFMQRTQRMTVPTRAQIELLNANRAL